MCTMGFNIIVRIWFVLLVLSFWVYFILQNLSSTYNLSRFTSRITKQYTPPFPPNRNNPQIPNKDINNLTPETKRLAEAFLQKSKELGYHLFITEWRRSWERQKALFLQWRTEPWTIVTWTMNSKHLRGIAFDVAFEPEYHWTAYPEDNQLRESIWEIGESLWLTRWWRWKQPDKPHFQYWW